MGAEVKARITVDAADALKRIEEINKASGYTSASMSKMAKEIGEANAALSSLGGGMGGTASGTAFKNITEQLEKQALAYTLVDSKSKAAAQSATLYRNAIISLTKSGSLTKEQTDELVRTYNNYKTAAESATMANNGFNSSLGGSGTKLLSVAKNILKFQLLMGPITAAIRGFKNTISESVKVAAEAEQVFNKLSTVFDTVANSANRAAGSVASLLGVAKSTAAGSLSTVGDLLQAQGMTSSESLSKASEWVKQFQDIIAFKDINMSLDEFAQTFMSGAAGNLRNFRTFGSIVKESAVQAKLAAEGLDKLTGSELELAKMTTRAEIALTQQANAMGATKREWDTMLSVTRRLEEAQKALKENLGEAINMGLKPMKGWWSDILTLISKSVQAANEYAKGIRDIQAFDTEKNASDKAMFRSALRDNDITMLKYNVYGAGDAVYQSQLNAIDKVLIQYGVSVSTFSKYLKEWGYENKISAKTLELLTQKEKDRNNELEKAAKLEAEYAETESIASAFENVIEAIKLLTGAGDISVGEMFNANSHMSFAQQLAEEVRVAGEQGFNNIKATDLTEFVSAVDLALGLVDEKSMITAKAETIKSLYTILFNQFTKDKTLEKNALLLQNIADYYKEITSEAIEMANAWDETLKKLQEATMSSVGSYARLLYEHNLTGTDAENTRDMAYYDAFKGKTDYVFQLTSEGMNFKDAMDEAQKWYDIQIKIADEEYDYAVKTLAQKEKEKILAESLAANLKAAEEAQKKIDSHTSSADNYRLQLAMFGMSSADQTRYRLGLQADEALDAGDLDLYKSIVNEIRAFNELQAATDKLKEEEEAAAKAAAELAAWKATGQRALGSTGTLGSVIQSFQGDGDIWTKIINAILTILENTENWGRIAEILDQIFAMFEPVTDALINLIVELPWDEIIFALKVVASAIVIISGIVQEIIIIAKWLGKNIMAAFRNIEVAMHNLFNRRDKWEYAQIESFDSLKKSLEKAAEGIVENTTRIWETEVDMANTLKKDDYAKQLALLKGLYDAGVLNADQYAGQVAKVTGSSLGSIERYNGSTYATGARGATYFSGNIVINGYNKDPEELAIEIERILERRAMAGANSY